MKHDICITDKTSGDQIRSYLLETMSLIQQIRNRVTSLNNNNTIVEDCKKTII
jgi:hypothetical protein